VTLWIFFYLHVADAETPLEETLAGVDRLYRAKKFKEFGLSNYLPFQVAQIYYICKINGYVRPTVYQGIYSLLTREVEDELFHVLRMLKIRFYAFSPLAGGLLVTKRKYEEKPQEGRFSRANYFDMLWKKNIFNEIEKFNNLCEKHNLSIREGAMRWILNHSKLSGEYGDAVILGASSVEQVKDNISITRGGPLPKELVKEIDQIWIRLSRVGANFETAFHIVHPISSL